MKYVKYKTEFRFQVSKAREGSYEYQNGDIEGIDRRQFVQTGPDYYWVYDRTGKSKKVIGLKFKTSYAAKQYIRKNLGGNRRVKLHVGRWE